MIHQIYEYSKRHMEVGETIVLELNDGAYWL